MRTTSSTPLACILTAALIGASGCTSTSSSNTARTGTEQLLISNAVDHALGKVDFRPLSGKKVYVEEKYVDCVDKGYVIGSVRHHVLRVGSQLVSKPEDAEIILELRSGGVGTDKSDSYLGVPEIVLPGMMTLPEVRLLSRSAQIGTAKIAMVAYDAKSSAVIGEGGNSLARSDDSNWYLLGMGPYQRGTLRTEVQESTKADTDSDAWKDKLPTRVTFRDSPQTPSSIRLAKQEHDQPQQSAAADASPGRAVLIDENPRIED